MLSKNTRINFLNNSNGNDFNEYFKKLSKLAKTSNEYKNIYDEDIEYVLNNCENIIEQKGGWFNESKLKGMISISDLNKNSYCNMITQKVPKDNSCGTRANDLRSILNVLQFESRGQHFKDKYDKDNWEIKIIKFIDYLLCCSSSYGKRNYESTRSSLIFPIFDIILKTEKFALLAQDKIRQILDNEDFIFIREAAIIEENRALNKDTFTDLGQRLEQQKELIKKYGMGRVYLSILIHHLDRKFI